MPHKVTTLDTAHFTLSFPNLVFALIAQWAVPLEFFVWAATTIFVSASGFDFIVRAWLTYFAFPWQFKVFAATAFRAVYYLTTMRTLVGVKCNVLDQLAKLIFKSSLILHLDLRSRLRSHPISAQQGCPLFVQQDKQRHSQQEFLRPWACKK